ncbi:MAG: TolC family protein [Pseudomonadota bacterium]
MKPTLLVLVTVTAALLGGCAKPPDLAPLQSAVVARHARVGATLAEGDFGRSVAHAVTTSTDLGHGDAALRQAQASLLAESGPFLPQVSVGLHSTGEPGFSVGSFASLSQLIYDGGASASRQTAAQARVLGSQVGRVDAASSAALRAVQAWAQVVTSRALADAAERSLLALEATSAKIEARSKAGLGSSAEALTAQSRLANDRAALAMAQSDVLQAEAIFAEAFGTPPKPDMALPPLAPSLPQPGAEGSPLLIRAQAEVFAAEADRAAALAGRVPAVSLSLGAIPGERVVSGLAAQQALSQARGRKARIAAAEAQVDARRVDLDATRRELDSRLRILTAQERAIEGRVKAARDAAAANEANLDIARSQFQAGTRNLIELLDAERESLSSERVQIQADHDRAVVGYAILAASGDILDLFGIVLPEQPAAYQVHP